MENIKLERGKCSVCGGSIDEQWAGKDPALGTKCEKCFHDKPEKHIFTAKNIQFVVQKTIIFNPLMGEYEYHFNFGGSQITINNKLGTIRSTQGDGSWVNFTCQDRLGDFINGLGYQDLIRIYKEAGFEINPPPLALPKCSKEKMVLLEKPIVPVIIDGKDTPKGPVVNAIYVGEEFGYKGMKIPFIENLHAFTNLYTRYKLGLGPNFCFEGGFVGKGFKVRNMIGSIGINIEMDIIELENIANWDELKQELTSQALVEMLYEHEQARPEVIKKDADINEVLSMWLRIMTTLLRYDWNKEKMETIEDIWHAYCTMQGILRNVMTEDEIEKSFAYAKDHKLIHYGKSY